VLAGSSTKHDIDSVQDLLEPFRWKSRDALSEEGAIDTDDLRSVRH